MKKTWGKLFLIAITAAVLAFGNAEAAKKREKKTVKEMPKAEKLEKAIFAGGCFWCMEPPFEKLDGVHSVVSGFCGGEEKEPSYEQVSAGETGHTESVEITYDPSKISYEKLLEIFWMNMDPTDAGGQFVDRGAQYRSAIFYLNKEQKKQALASKEKLEKSSRFKDPLVTEISPATAFWPAEDYHQDYYKKNPIRYKYYRYGSGRDKFLDKIWGKDRKNTK